jgi:hypothetical protein
MKRVVISSDWARIGPMIFGLPLLAISALLLILSMEPGALFLVAFPLFLVVIGIRTAQVSVGYKRIFIKQFFKREKEYLVENLVRIDLRGFGKRYKIIFSNGDSFHFSAPWSDYFPNPFPDLSEYYMRRIKELAG